MGRATLNRVEDDQIGPLVEGLVNGITANTADAASEGVRTHTKLRLVTSNVPDQAADEARQTEAPPERHRFHIVGIDRPQMPDGLWTVVRGEVNGEPKALLFKATDPPELLLPTEPASELKGFMNRLGRSVFGRVMFALGSAAAAEACTSPDFGNANGDGGISEGVYGTHQAALTSADADNLGPPTLIPGSTWGDQHPNIAEIGGQKVLLFSRADGNMWYVDCADFADCLATGVGAPDLIGGLPAVPGGQIRRGAIFQDGGGDKIAYGMGGTVGWRAISYGAGGTLEAPVFGGALAPPMSTGYLGHMKIGGESHITWNAGGVALRNMATGVDTGLGIPGLFGADSCGVPHQDDAGIAIGSDYIDLGGGVYRCHLIQAPTLADLAASVNYINSQNVTGPPAVIHDRLVNPRVFGNYLIYARYDENPPGSGNWEPRMYYAVVQEYCGNGACAGGETPGSCPADCPPLPAEVCDDGADNDGDGDTDCADPDCAADPACVPPPAEICDDGVDNDGDGNIDCADPDCAADPACAPPPAEICDDGVDNDGDGAADCADPDCAADPGCAPPPPEVCDDGIDNDGDGATDCADPDCAAAPACAPPPAEVCDDGVDNDGDGATDCADPDCAEDVACEEPPPAEICDDEVDNDEDGATDCADPDCAEAIECEEPPPAEVCDDGVDNDGDGATDCADPECAADPACVPPIDACDFAEARITITEGECNLDKCEDPFVDVVGACTFEVDLGNENPVTIEIDGTYGLDFLNDAGELLAGSYKVIDDGNGMDTVTGNLVTGVEGTIYGGDLNQEANTYHVYCEEGRITISYNGEVIATLDAGQEQTFDLDDPVPDDDDTPDGGDDDTPDGGDDTSDGGDDDVSDGGDTPPPPGGCSCDIKGGSESNAAIAGVLLLMAVAFMRRRIKASKIR